jgi:spermidine/putrescine-binding protein
MLTSTNTEGINMYLKKITLVAILLGFAACAGLANADDNAAGAWGQNMSPEQREAAKQRYSSATPEQQEAYRKKMEMRKQKMENMTPEQQAELKAQQEQRKKQWQSMTPEQREAVKQKYRNQQQ